MAAEDLAKRSSYTRAVAGELRTQRILDLLTHAGRVEVDGLVSELNASPATVRRELARLEQQGLIKRDRGGAYLSVPTMFEPFLDDCTFANQIKQMAAEKARIGALAASLVKDGDTVGLAPGTTTTHVARFLQQRKNLTIVTNAVNIAMELSRKRDFKIHLTGGLLSGDWFAMVGPRALSAMAEIKMDYCFFGANGVSAEHGVSNRHIEEAATNRAMIRHSRKRILVADHLKLGEVANCLVCPIQDVGVIVTDKGAPKELLAPFDSVDTQILLA
jgi:DeoR family transcriptional regulator, aga operon transcriptional repressor